jgi:hypothetical protein
MTASLEARSTKALKELQECSVEREPPFRQDVRAEAEESPLLEAVIRKRLIN